MVKTVRIASILTALLAVALVALPVVSGAIAGDKKPKESFEAQSVVEEFKKTRGDRAKKDADQVPPLVKEAKDFALYLNPPKPKVERVRPPVKIALPPVQPIPRSAKFNLIATCVHKSNPALSVALIDEPGLDRRWVRQSAAIGHLIIKEIREGSVIINDGTRTYGLPMAEKPVRTSLVVGKSSADASTLQTARPPLLPDIIKSEKTALTQKQIPAAKKPPETVRDTEQSLPTITSEEQELLDKLINEVDSIIVESGDDETAREQSFEKADALIEKYFSELENMRITGKEAQKLDDLGKKLDSEKKDPNQAEGK